MKLLKYFVLTLSVAIICLSLTACRTNINNNGQYEAASVVASQSITQTDNTAASENHDKIYYYNDSGNVAYDISGCYDCCFMTPYLAAHPTGGALHGIGVAQDFDEARVWPTLATNFIKRLGF